MRLSEELKVAPSDVAGICMVLSEETKALLLEWIPVDRRLGAVRHGDPCKGINRSPNRRKSSQLK